MFLDTWDFFFLFFLLVETDSHINEYELLMTCNGRFQYLEYLHESISQYYPHDSE